MQKYRACLVVSAEGGERIEVVVGGRACIVGGPGEPAASMFLGSGKAPRTVYFVNTMTAETLAAEIKTTLEEWETGQ